MWTKEKQSDYYKIWRSLNKQRIAEYQAAYRAENESRLKQQKRIRYLADKESVIERSSDWASKHPEERRAITAKYRATNKDVCNARISKWGKEHPDRRNEIARVRRARKRAAIIKPISATFFALALEAWNHRCAYCRCDLHAPGVRLEWDHFRPIARGGVEAEYNYVPACSVCNRSKNARDPFAFIFDIKRQEDIEKFSRTDGAILATIVPKSAPRMRINLLGNIDK